MQRRVIEVDGLGLACREAGDVARADAEKLEHAVIRGSGEYLAVEAPDVFIERLGEFAGRVLG
jgi:hypothetical protein